MAIVWRKGSVVWQDSQRGGPGHYRWSIASVDGFPAQCGVADDETLAWQYIRDRVADRFRSVRRVGRRTPRV